MRVAVFLQIPDAEFSDMWTSMRLPVICQEAASERLAHLRDDEERCLDLLKQVGGLGRSLQ